MRRIKTSVGKLGGKAMTHTLQINGIPKPAKYYFPSGAVCGNGDLCLMVGTAKDVLTLHLAKSDF